MASEHVEATLVDEEAAAKQPDLVDAPEDAPAHEGSVMKKPSSKAEAKAKPNYDELSISEDDHVPATPKTAKAKASSKAKAQALFKRPAGKPTPVLKRPAAAGSTNEPETKKPKNVLKKPAAKATKRLVDNFKFEEDEQHDTHEGEEEEPREEDDTEEEDAPSGEVRDRVKARKFMQMMKDGLIPCAAQEAYNRCSGRAEQTRLINSLFVLEGKKLVIQPKFTVPKEYTRTQDQETEDKATYRKNGFGKLIFKRMYSLTQEDLDQALSTGEVICWKSGGLTLYAAVNQEFKNSSAKNSKDSLSTGRVELDSLAGESFAKVFDAMTPSIEVSNPPGSSKQTNRPSSSQLLAWQCRKWFLQFHNSSIVLCSVVPAHGESLSFGTAMQLFLRVLAACSCVSCSCLFLHVCAKPKPVLRCRRLALCDNNTDEGGLQGDAVWKAKNALEIAKTALGKLTRDCKFLAEKIDRNDDIYAEVTLICKQGGSCVGNHTHAWSSCYLLTVLLQHVFHACCSPAQESHQPEPLAKPIRVGERVRVARD